MRKMLIVPILFVTIFALAGAPVFAQSAAQSPVKVQPPAALRAMADNPTPPADAKQVKSAGKGKAMKNTANTPDDTDASWAAQVDIDGDGVMEQADLVWDDEDHVLYLYADKAFVCANGGTGNGGILMAVYGKGNAKKRPAGSGWYIVELDKSVCAAEAAGIYGCRFNAQGNATACGAAVIDEKHDDITIVAVKKLPKTG